MARAKRYLRAIVTGTVVVAAAMAIALVSSACGGGKPGSRTAVATASPTAIAKMAAVASASTPIPWVDQPRTTPTPIPTPTPVAHTFPPCTAHELRPDFVLGEAHAGGFDETYQLTDIGTTGCSLSGFPIVLGIHKDGTQEQLYYPAPDAPAATPVNLEPGQGAQIRFGFQNCGMFPQDQTPVPKSNPVISTVISVSGSDVTLPAGGNRTDGQIPPVEDSYTCGGGVSDYYPASIPFPSPVPYPGLVASLSVAKTATADSLLNYTVTLKNTSAKPVALQPYPSYFEYLDPAGHVAGFEPQGHGYQLNCSTIRSIPPHSSVSYAMRFPMPDVSMPSQAVLTWSIDEAPFQTSGIVSAYVMLTIEPAG